MVLEAGKVALQVQTPTGMENLDMNPGQEIVIYIRLMVREEDIILYGFSCPEERNLFNMVLGVSGIGPRLALALLGSLDPNQFYNAVLEENISLLCQAPGVGRKVAQRLILELKEKLPGIMVPVDAAPASAGSLSLQQEVVEALCALGYSRAEALTAANRATREHQGKGERDDILKAALKSMAGG